MTTAVKGLMTAQQAYESVEKMIHYLSARYWRMLGGEYDELVSKANYHFARAWNDWQPERAKLTTIVWWYVTRGLNDYVRGLKAKKRSRREVNLEDWNGLAYRGTRDVMAELDGDALVAAELALASEGKSNVRRWAVAQTLARIGWGSERILSAFDGVRGVL